MISEFEFKKALKIVASYKMQVEQDLHKSTIAYRRTINIQNDIPEYTFRALHYYCLEEFEIDLKKDDLKSMDIRLLGLINYDKLKKTRGFGKIKLYNFKKLLVSHSILDGKDTSEITNKLNKKYLN